MQQPPKQRGERVLHDRFIPTRTTSDLTGRFDILEELASASREPDTNENAEPPPEVSDASLSYKTLLYNQVLGIKDPFTIHQLNRTNYVYSGYPYSQTFSVLQTRDSGIVTAPYESAGGNENAGYTLPHCAGFSEDSRSVVAPPKVDRKIAKVPFKVLDAPALQDDFYLNVVDWSTQGLLAVGLGSTVYLWSAANGKVTKLNDVGPNDSVTSVGWSPKGTCLAIGTQAGMLQLWDAKRGKQIRLIKGHEGRIGSIAWTSQILSTGSRDKTIVHRDIRQKAVAFAKLQGHKQEVCGLRWSPDEQQLASGGNDNRLLVWSVQNNEQPSGRYCSHTAAVKALAWSPHQHGLLASGGGTADRCIKLWNTLSNSAIDSIDTGSQVCSMLFSRNTNELVSAHGYSQNQIVVWKYPTMRKLATLTGHTFRVLYLAMSNDGETIVSGAGDETLRFWRVFPPSHQNQQDVSLLVPSNKDLR